MGSEDGRTLDWGMANLVSVRAAGVRTPWKGVMRPADTRETGPRGRLQVLDQRDAAMGLRYR